MQRVKPRLVPLLVIAGLLAGLIFCPVAFNFLFGIFVVVVLTRFFAKLARRPKLAAATFGGGVLCVAISIWINPDIKFWPYLALAGANIAVAYAFGNHVLHNRSTTLARFVEEAHKGPDPAPDFLEFLRRQCIIWAGFALSTVALSVAAMVPNVAQGKVAPILVVLLGVQVVWFVMSHKYAQYRYQRPETWQASLALIAQPKVLARIEI